MYESLVTRGRFRPPMMKAIRVASFLALLSTGAVAGQGWYLVAPPWDRIPTDIDDPRKWPITSWSEVVAKLLKRVPYSEWATYRAFDTAEDCEKERERRIDNASKMLDRTRDLPARQAASDTMMYWSLARCLASDDPRLK